MHGRIIPWSTKKIASLGEGLCSFAKRRHLHKEMVIYLHIQFTVQTHVNTWHTFLWHRLVYLTFEPKNYPCIYVLCTCYRSGPVFQTIHWSLQNLLFYDPNLVSFQRETVGGHHQYTNMGQAVTDTKSELINTQRWRYPSVIKVRLCQCISVNEEGEQFTQDYQCSCS